MSTTRDSTTYERLCQYLQLHPEVKQAILFGSLAKGGFRQDSDVDLAIALDHVLGANEKQRLLEDIAVVVGHPVDLIDLKVVGEPLLGQILRYGKQLVGDSSMYAGLLSKHVTNQADFMPYRQHILDERRKAWIG